MIPGSNLLKQALRVIAPSTVTYNRFLARVLNSIGLYENTYEAPVQIKGSFQPVPRQMYAEFGLNLEKRYALFYTLSNMITIERDKSNDTIIFAGITYQCEANSEWYQIDGWNATLISAIVT